MCLRELSRVKRITHRQKDTGVYDCTRESSAPLLLLLPASGPFLPSAVPLAWVAPRLSGGDDGCAGFLPCTVHRTAVSLVEQYEQSRPRLTTCSYCVLFSYCVYVYTLAVFVSQNLIACWFLCIISPSCYIYAFRRSDEGMSPFPWLNHARLGRGS